MTTHFQTYLLFTFIMPKFFKFCNHFIINLKKSTMFLLSYFKLFSTYILLLVSKIRQFFDYFGDVYFFCIHYHAFTQTQKWLEYPLTLKVHSHGEYPCPMVKKRNERSRSQWDTQNLDIIWKVTKIKRGKEAKKQIKRWPN